ncbi:MAG: ankyrin repeat domain-containing protein [Colwellia sp.]|nr:ankyrin repeat domain-containing protein [Colwellia sp.]
MLFELTIFASFAVYHLLIGCSLFLILTLAFKLFKFTAELKSWLWITVFVVSTLLPFSLFVDDVRPNTYATKQTDNLTNSSNKSGESALISSQKFTEQQPNPVEWNVPSKDVLAAMIWIYLFLTIWLIGSCWRGVSVIRSAYFTHKLVSKAMQDDKRLQFTHISAFPIFMVKGVSTPMATGLLSPIILVPDAVVERFEAKKLEPIILHEVAHIQRNDLWVGLFQEALAIIFWWSPVMRILNRRIHISRELACDMRAAKQLNSGKNYAQSLVDCAQLMLSQHTNILAMGLFAKKSELNQRVNEVLKIKSNRTPKTITTIIACIALAVSSVAAAQYYAPKINVTNLKQESNHYSSMSSIEGEKLVNIIRRDDRQALHAMLATGMDINTPFSGEGTALLLAVRHGNRQLMEDLISMGADVNQTSEGDGSPLMEAVILNRLDLMEYLYDHGANVNSKAFGDGSALIEAAKRGNIAAAKFLIDNGAHVNMGVAEDETPLINASQSGDLAMVTFLVENGADVNLGMEGNNLNGPYFRTPLNITRNKNVTAYLVSQGATEK